MIAIGSMKNNAQVLRPNHCDEYISFALYCDLTEKEQRAIFNALVALDAQLAKDGIFKPICLSVIILDGDSFTLSCSDNRESMGTAIRLALLQVGRWRRECLAVPQMTVAALEELCHIAFSIDDEILVQNKVTDCLRNIYPNVRREDLYNLDWKP